MNDVLYVNARSTKRILTWSDTNSSIWQNRSSGAGSSTSIFVSYNGDIYFDTNSSSTCCIHKWTLNATAAVPVMSTSGLCHGLFVDFYDNIYCSMGDYHRVIKRSVKDPSNATNTIAGNGTSGSASTLLSAPRGIFVTTNFSLYVADCGNDRIQLFLFNQTMAMTVVGGNRSNETIALHCPTGITLDGQGQLFIVDSLNHRVVGPRTDGYRCIIGCTAIAGGAMNQLNTPTSLSFDSRGNLYIADFNNSRIQKFLVNDAGCRE